MNRILSGFVLVVLILAVVYFYGPTIYRFSTDRTALADYLSQAGLWAPIIFVLLMAVQVVVAPLPGLIVGLVGGYIFGPLQGFILNLIGYMLGAMIAFSLARCFGWPLVHRFLGQRYDSLFQRIGKKRGVLILALAFLIPFAPDDAVCFLAALTPMPAKLFAVFVIIFRTPGLLLASLTGAGVIRLSGQAWIIIAASAAVLLPLAWFNKARLTRLSDRLFDTLLRE